MGTTAAAICATLTAPTSAGDLAADLKSAIDTARSESGCPPLQLDPRLNEISQRVDRDVDDYVRHAARELPITGENDLIPTGKGGVARVLREYGYPTNKVKLLNGYGDNRTGGTGDNAAKAIKAVLLESMALEVFSNCATYTKYGLNAMNDEHTQEGWPSTAPKAFSVAAVVLAGD